MKKRILATVLTMAMAISMVAVPQVVKAAEGETTMEATAAESAANDVHINGSSDTSKEIGTQDISVTANTTGAGDKIIYSVSVSWGKMEFNYTYGNTWDPEHHKYKGDGDAGWSKVDLNGKNNIITVINNSNYPINVAMTSQMKKGAFNSSITAKNSVIGIFYDDNHEIAKDASMINDEKYSGAGMANENNLTQMNFSLDTYDEDNKYHDALGSGDVPQRKDVYYALCGKPDVKDKDLAATEVSTIKITISPYKD